MDSSTTSPTLDDFSTTRRRRRCFTDAVLATGPPCTLIIFCITLISADTPRPPPTSPERDRLILHDLYFFDSPPIYISDILIYACNCLHTRLS